MGMLLQSGALRAQSAPAQGAPARPAPSPPITSLLGRVLMPRPVNASVDSAKDLLAKQPNDVSTLVATGQAYDGVWQFGESIALYSKAITLAPKDARSLSFRGQRYLSTRQFDRAIADLEVARKRAPQSFHSLYHLGLAYYYVGRYAEAASTLGQCADVASRAATPSLQSSAVAQCDDLHDGLRFALASWRSAALMRAGRVGEAKAVLEKLPTAPNSAVPEGRWYIDAVDIARGRKSDTLWSSVQVNGGGVLTIGYALANLSLVRGDSAKGCRILRELVAREEWPGFGYIGAEVDLARGRCSGVK
ncbi:MAG TPA: tetratricopeptide repeat protein [Gemmatimonas sp.]|uniref:tetratricopeptide repeat protein n=1 Tax=Gemmatimonas sp. TaxID=1962908 RepID=UPI002ED8DFBA